MKVMHVVQSLKGGPATYFNETIPAMIDELGGDNVVLLVPADDIDVLSKRLAAAKIRTFATRKRSLGSLGNFVGTVLKAIREEKPDIVHLHSTFAGVILRPFMPLGRSRPAIVYCPHGWAFDMEGASGLRNQVVIMAEKLLAWRTDRIINISTADQHSAMALGIGRGKSILLRNAIADTGPPVPITEEGKLALGMDPAKVNILFVGRFDRQKGLDLALDAMRRVDADRFCLHIIGDFVLTDDRRGWQDELNNTLTHSGAVRRLGWRSREEIVNYYQAADLLIIPSRWEGFGLVAIEGMCMGTPVLASAVGGLSEIVVDRVCGRLLHDPSGAGFAEILMQEKMENWRQYGVAARARFLDEFTIDVLNQGLINLYRDLHRSRH